MVLLSQGNFCKDLLCGLVNTLIFMVIGAAFVIGGRCFNYLCTCFIASSTSSTWQQVWKCHGWRLVALWHSSQKIAWSIMQRCRQSCCKESGTHEATGSGNASMERRSHLASAREQLASEVAILVAGGSSGTATELLHCVQAARGALQPGPECFRMLMQGLAHSSPKGEALTPSAEELLRSLPGDVLSQGCYVRYLCRRPEADVKKAHQAYADMLGKGITPDIRTVECLVEACLRASQLALVEPLIFALEDHDLQPSAPLYAALMVAYSVTGDVARGMVALELMRPLMDDDPVAAQLGYSSAIHMCARSHQIDRALQLLGESQQLARKRSLPPASLEARLLVPLLAAAVQAGRAELALDLAARARVIIVEATATPKDEQLKAHLAGLCQLLRKRRSSQLLMLEVSAILDSPVTNADAKLATVGLAASCHVKGKAPASRDTKSWNGPNLFQMVCSALHRLRARKGGA